MNNKRLRLVNTNIDGNFGLLLDKDLAQTNVLRLIMSFVEERNNSVFTVSKRFLHDRVLILLETACKVEELKFIKLVLEKQSSWEKCWRFPIVGVDNILLEKACMYGNVKLVKLLLKEGIGDIAFEKNSCFNYACLNGHLGVVKLLLGHPKVNPNDEDTYGFIQACSAGYVEIVKLLLRDSRIDHSSEGLEAATLASENGHKEVLRLLFLDEKIVYAASLFHNVIKESFVDEDLLDF
jgi:hypothetical protein